MSGWWWEKRRRACSSGLQASGSKSKSELGNKPAPVLEVSTSRREP